MQGRFSSFILPGIIMITGSVLLCLFVPSGNALAQTSILISLVDIGIEQEVRGQMIEHDWYLDIHDVSRVIGASTRYSPLLQRATFSDQENSWVLYLGPETARSQDGEEIPLTSHVFTQERQLFVTRELIAMLLGTQVQLTELPSAFPLGERPDRLIPLQGVRHASDGAAERTRIVFDFEFETPPFTVAVDNDHRRILVRFGWCVLDREDHAMELADPRVETIELTPIDDDLQAVIGLHHPVQVEQGVIVGANPRIYLDITPLSPTVTAADGINARLVILDPGYGGRDSGAVVDDVRSSDVALQVAQRVRHILVKRGYAVIMTRDGDDTLSAAERYALINWHAPLVFISLRLNYHSHPAARGMEAFIEPPRPRMSSEGIDLEPPLYSSRDLSTAFGHELLDSITTRTGQVNRGLKESPFPLLDRVIYPGVVLYLGFLSHPDEYQLMVSPSYQKLLAEGVIAAIEGYRESPAYQDFWTE